MLIQVSQLALCIQDGLLALLFHQVLVLLSLLAFLDGLDVPVSIKLHIKKTKIAYSIAPWVQVDLEVLQVLCHLCLP